MATESGSFLRRYLLRGLFFPLFLHGSLLFGATLSFKPLGHIFRTISAWLRRHFEVDRALVHMALFQAYRPVGPVAVQTEVPKSVTVLECRREVRTNDAGFSQDSVHNFPRRCPDATSHKNPRHKEVCRSQAVNLRTCISKSATSLPFTTRHRTLWSLPTGSSICELRCLQLLHACLLV